MFSVFVGKKVGSVEFTAYFICCILESHKKLLHDFKLQLNYCLETYSTTPAATNIKQHLLMSGSQPWQVLAFMVPPGPSVPWLGQTGRRGIPAGGLPTSNPPTLPTLSDRLKEGTAALRQPLRGASAGPSSLSVHKDFSYVSIRPQWAPNIAQLTSWHKPRPANPCCSPSRVLYVNQ